MPDQLPDDTFFKNLAAASEKAGPSPAPPDLKNRLLSALTSAPAAEDLFAHLGAQFPEVSAPSRLKSRIYSALMVAQSEEGSLRSLSACKEEGRPLCVFETLVRIAPVGQRAQSINYCRVCHSRVLAEHFERAPIYWDGCPYASFQHH